MTEHPSPAQAPKAASWAYAESFVEQTEASQATRDAARDFGVTPLLPGAASLLTVLAAAISAKAVVEIGSGTGTSGLALFAGMAPDGILTSIDLEAEHQAAARRAFVAAGIAPQRFRLITGSALSILPNLRDGAYDLVFVDADKLEYVEYMEQALRLLRPGGLVVVDNALWHDRVADPKNEDDETVIIREALESAKASEGLRLALAPSGDGLLIGVKG